MASPVYSQDGYIELPAKSAAKSQVAVFRIVVPDADALVWVGGHKTTSTGVQREYKSPPITVAAAGDTYEYAVRVAWIAKDGKERMEEWSVRIIPGATTLTKLVPGTGLKLMPPALDRQQSKVQTLMN